ncbi:hypothetical protein JQS43_17830 [Natronosporangium hydrolyticum]|uniref:VOC domain-containing protein n=1 Tax=Natronosporangium hydrolyticum TaxID=2811111 RepID=A0A895Y7X6_9ACTN|nr:hypothetical protein [Natronosporangium hydrolyticum]QSB13451.1 hypothetical protein JQS43_17830 [Natronosporangium hydrolyticum]
MSVVIDHVGIPAYDKQRTMEWTAHILGLPPGPVAEPFAVLDLDGANLDYFDHGEGELPEYHVALRVTEAELDEIYGRVVAAGVTTYGLPTMTDQERDTIYYSDGGRGFYFLDPNRHVLEVKTVRDRFDADALADMRVAPFTPATR